MCGIAGYFNRNYDQSIDNSHEMLSMMLEIQNHRGPDNAAYKVFPNVGLGHNRLSIIDLSQDANQPMQLGDRYTIVFNGEIYNHNELRKSVLSTVDFKTNSDTEVILHLYALYGVKCVEYLRGMFAFALYDRQNHSMFLARDRIGIKPLYICEANGVVMFASEVKTLLPLIPHLDINYQALNEYLHFNYCLGGKTLVSGINEVEPAHFMLINNDAVRTNKYWDIPNSYNFDITQEAAITDLRMAHEEAILLHGISDVEIGGYVSGGVDSSFVYAGVSNIKEYPVKGFTGRFLDHGQYDESQYALDQINLNGGEAHICTYGHADLAENIENILYHLDFPVAGPGAIPQYLISRDAAKHVKVVTGGQGGDEIFGGYARYLLCYFEQAMKHRIKGTDTSDSLILNMESILPSLPVLDGYQPMMQTFFSKGMFGSIDSRYFALVDRSRDWAQLINPEILNQEAAFEAYKEVFDQDNNPHLSAFDQMTRYDFRTSLRGLLHVEDRMSMAHGLESRVPLLDHVFVETAARIPANIKYKRGEQKRLLKLIASKHLAPSILRRTDKMGFPLPLNNWLKNELSEFFGDLIHDTRTLNNEFYNDFSFDNTDTATSFSRQNWSIIGLHYFRLMLKSVQKMEIRFA